jgi:hypothetical protein
MHRSFSLLLFFLLTAVKLSAQSFPVGQLELDGAVRNLQLMGKITNSQSFLVRPIYNSPNDSFFRLIDSSSNIGFKKIRFKDGKNGLSILPLVWTSKYNSHHPYGWNDDVMIAAKGFQSNLTAGFHFKLGPLTAQIQPSYFYAANPNFDNNYNYGEATNGSQSKLILGQSSLRLNVGPISLGVSNENLWWGPGQFSALLMSNNAPGFKHITFNTTRPLKTPIGNFEFQIIGGRLEEDSLQTDAPYENFFLKAKAFKKDWRYMNGMVISYQPAFFKGFFIGATRSFQLYGEDFELQDPNFMQKYVPVLSALFKNNTVNEDAKARDQQLSIFSRWLLERANAEFYFEYGYNDHKANLRDFALAPVHAAAYIVGAKKLVPIPKNKWIELNFELTQMAQNIDYLVRNAGNWYEHSSVKQGLTNQRQILGAGSGMGNNVQTFSATWLNGFKKIGFKLQRIQQDPIGFRGNFSSLALANDPWNDFSIGLVGRWNYRKWVASAELQHVSSKNYAWSVGKKTNNFYGLLNIAYLW